MSNSITREYQGDKIKQTCTRYDYDAFGRRIAKHSEIRHLVLEPNENNDNPFKQHSKTQFQHTHMLWDGDRPIQEYSDTHVYTTIHDQGSFAPIARAVWLKEGSTLAANDEPDNSYDDSKPKQSDMQVFYYHNDQLGTPNELTNEDGEVVWLADYEAWGNTAKVVWNETKLKPVQIEKEYLQPIRFQGQNFDEETGLHYNRFRYYDPDMGMFISRDPIGLMGGDNVFAYAPNPTGWIDPLGLAMGSGAEYVSKGLPKGSGAKNVGRGLKIGKVTLGFPGVLMEAVKPNSTSRCADGSCSEEFLKMAEMTAKASQVIEASEECTSCRKCPECKPYPVGTRGFRGPEKHNTGKNAGNLHYHIYIVAQKNFDNGCECYWDSRGKVTKKLTGNHDYPYQPNPLAVDLNGKGDPPPYP